MELKEEKYDAIVIGAGHAGCEAALALARTNQKTLLLTISLDSIAFLACNPSIGGTAKGHLVCEIDALGGQMGINADQTLIQKRMLNLGKGPAVYSLRAQADKELYHQTMKHTLENQDNLYIKQAEVVDLKLSDGDVFITTAVGEVYISKTAVIATGVYLKSKIIIGEYIKDSGPNGFANSIAFSQALKNLGIKLYRFKTGTPARINGRSIDFSVMEDQCGDDDIQNFSFITKMPRPNISKCYLTYTNQNTHKIIETNLYRAPMYSGLISGVGPRYCPSIETKIVRFKDKEKHQLFLEPEALSTNEYYIQGASTSLPVDVQKEMYRSIRGLENCEIMRDAYAIEYDCIDSLELSPALSHIKYPNLFFAGQINGTSGYEEAAAQGLIAGINASLYLRNKEPLILKRSDAYIGVLIDDLVTKGTNEPYRMMTSRAEFRLLLRQDNADLRLTEYGRQVGLVDDSRYNIFNEKLEKINKLRTIINTKCKKDDKLIELFNKNSESLPEGSISFRQMIKRSNLDIFKINEVYHEFDNYDKNLLLYINTEVKYEGYLKQQEEDAEKLKKDESIKIPKGFDYTTVKNLRSEAVQKLQKIRPLSIGQASRISGVSPADIAVLAITIKKLGYN